MTSKATPFGPFGPFTESERKAFQKQWEIDHPRPTRKQQQFIRHRAADWVAQSQPLIPNVKGPATRQFLDRAFVGHLERTGVTGVDLTRFASPAILIRPDARQVFYPRGIAPSVTDFASEFRIPSRL